MVDIHSHIIYGIDDGAKDKEMTIKMLKIAAEKGTKKIIATPHYYRGRFIAPFKAVRDRIAELNEIIKENNINLEVFAGQEVFFTKSILDDLEKGLIGTLNDSRYMLIEFDMVNIDNCAFDILYELKLKGIVPVIAHPERYKLFADDIRKINDFIDEGYLFQLNANSLSGLLGKQAKKISEIFLKNNIYSFIASDAHTDRKRDTDIKRYEGIINNLNAEFLKQASINGEKLLNNEEVFFEGNKMKDKKRSFFEIFRKK